MAETPRNLSVLAIFRPLRPTGFEPVTFWSVANIQVAKIGRLRSKIGHIIGHYYLNLSKVA